MYTFTPGCYGDDRVKVEFTDVADLHNLLIYCKTNFKSVWFNDCLGSEYELTGINPMNENIEYHSENGVSKSESLDILFNHMDKQCSFWINAVRG